MRTRTAGLLLRGGFRPPNIPGLEAWFRFGRGITSAAGAVSQWDDASGKGRHLKQATGSAQPALQSDGSILFDGTTDFLKCDPFTFSQPETVYLLFRYVTFTNNDYIFDGNADSSLAVYQKAAAPTLTQFLTADGASNTGLALNTYGVLCAVFNGASSSLRVGGNAATTGSPGATNAGGFTLAASGGGLGQFSNIQAKEAFLYSGAHDAGYQARAMNYLSMIGRL